MIDRGETGCGAVNRGARAHYIYINVVSPTMFLLTVFASKIIGRAVFISIHLVFSIIGFTHITGCFPMIIVPYFKRTVLYLLGRISFSKPILPILIPARNLLPPSIIYMSKGPLSISFRIYLQGRPRIAACHLWV